MLARAPSLCKVLWTRRKGELQVAVALKWVTRETAPQRQLFIDGCMTAKVLRQPFHCSIKLLFSWPKVVCVLTGLFFPYHRHKHTQEVEKQLKVNNTFVCAPVGAKYVYSLRIPFSTVKKTFSTVHAINADARQFSAAIPTPGWGCYSSLSFVLLATKGFSWSLLMGACSKCVCQ